MRTWVWNPDEVWNDKTPSIAPLLNIICVNNDKLSDNAGVCTIVQKFSDVENGKTEWLNNGERKQERHEVIEILQSLGFLAVRRISCCCGLNGAITKFPISFKTVIIKGFSIRFYGLWEHLVPQLNRLMRRNVFFSDFVRLYVWVCLSVWQKERKMKWNVYRIFVQSDMSLNWVSWLRQGLSPPHYSLAKVPA